MRRIKQQKKQKCTVKIASHQFFNGANLVGTMQTAVMDIAIISWSSI